MGKYTKMFETGDYDAMQFGASVHWVLGNANKKLTGEEKQRFDEYLEMCNDGAHWVTEHNHGVGMPKDAAKKIMKLYDERHKEALSTRDKVVGKVKSSRKKTESK